jgi:glutamyl-Q tRNA(Asp) synthetase
MRGSDLLDSTPRQIYLQKILGYSQPQYAHLPVANNDLGQKLSKQNLAAGLPYGQEAINLWIALDWLKQSPPNELRQLTIGHILTWAVDHWDQTQVPAKLTLTAPEGF